MNQTAPAPAVFASLDVQTQLQQIVDHTSAAVFVKDLDGRFLFVNREFERMKGIPVDAIVGRRDDDVFPSAAIELRRNDGRVVSERRAMDFEETVETAQGRRTYLAHKFPLVDAAHRTYAVCGIATDITDRKRTEEALRAVALAVSTAQGERLYAELARYLADVLDVDVALISVFADEGRKTMRTLAARLDGAPLANFVYALEGSPCRAVAGRAFRFVAAGVNSEFPPGTLFAAKGMDSYAALPLNDASGQPIGLIAAMDREPMRDPALAEAILKIFAVRAVAEVERVRAEAALAASETSYRAIFEANEDAIFVHDWATGAVLDVSPKASELFGYPRDALCRLRVGDISSDVPPYTEAEAFAQIERAKASATPIRFEWHARHRDGKLMWHEVTLKRAVIAGAPRVIAFVRDVTERKRAEEALQASEAQYRAIFNASADAMVLWNSQYRRVDVNLAYQKMYGWAREDVIGRGYEHPNFSPAYAKERLALVRRALGGEDCQTELDAIRADGCVIRTEVHAIPFQHRGEPHVLSIARDITERKRAEEELRASEAQYRAIFEAATDSLQLIDAGHRVVDVNPAYEKMYGKPRSTVVGRTLDELVPAEYRAERHGMVERALAGEAAEIQSTGFRGDGTPFELEVRVIPFRHRGQPHVLGIARDITERKRAEVALRASEEQYRAIFNASADALVLRDADFRIVDVNATYERMSGWSRDEVLNLDRVVANPEDVAPAVRALHERALAGEAVSLEVPLVRRDGTRYELELRGVLTLHRGRPHVLYMGRDITERKRAEAALRASEEQYRAIFNASADALMLWNSRLQRVDVNPAHCTIFGFAREEVVGRGFEGLPYPEEYARPRIEMVRRALAGEAIASELEAIRKDGRHIITEMRTIPFTHRGEPHVLQIARDVTASRSAENALRISEEQYRAIFNASADALVLWNSLSQRVDVNPAYEQLYGYKRDEVLGGVRSHDIPEDLRKRQEAIVARTLAGERCHEEFETYRRSGERFPIEVRTIPIQHRGEPHVLAMIRDLTKQRQAERDRARLEAQLRQAQKMEAIGHLTGGIAHDFNNLLTSIMGYVTLAAERSGGGDPKVATYLSQAGLSCGRARDLIQQMLTFSRGRRGEPRALTLAPLVRESVKLLRSSFPATVELRTELDDEAPPVLLDPVQLDQVLMNLAINARDGVHSSGQIRIGVGSAGPTTAVCASCRQTFEGSFVELVIADTGTGIPPEVQERMFEPFFTTKEVGRGSGMGLSTVHGIVHEHGGHIAVESAPGKGSIFRVLFPALRSHEDVGAQATRVAAGHSLPHAALAAKVAVVDDEVSVAGFMRDLLVHWGLTVTTYGDAREALDALRAGATFDLVVTDQTMPGMTGLEFARRARELCRGLQVVLYTGYGEGIAPIELERAGVAALMRKPIEPSDLLAVLRRSLGR